MKLIEISLYDLHSDPKSLYGYNRADMEVVDVFWDKYENNPEELKKREDAIATSAIHSYLYAMKILDNRFPKGEDAIAKSAQYSYLYAHSVIRGKWPKGEDAIAKSAYYSFYYAKFINERFPKGEPAIMRDTFYAYIYAKEILQRRWPEAEKYIKKNPCWKEKYEYHFEVKL